jgi:hypothetical protein
MEAGLRIWVILAALAAVVAAGLFLWWRQDLRWRPRDLDQDSAEIARLLEGAGWVSPGLNGPKLYMVGFRGCPNCVQFKAESFPALHAAGVDTRVIEIAQRDSNGVPRSTPQERATVAELWIGRRWALAQAWEKVPPAAWTAPGIPPADGDPARTAAVEAGRDLVDKLQPLLARNGVRFAYPTLVWWTRDGQMRGCTCEKPHTYRFVLKELGAEPS